MRSRCRRPKRPGRPKRPRLKRPGRRRPKRRQGKRAEEHCAFHRRTFHGTCLHPRIPVRRARNDRVDGCEGGSQAQAVEHDGLDCREYRSVHRLAVHRARLCPAVPVHRAGDSGLGRRTSVGEAIRTRVTAQPRAPVVAEVAFRRDLAAGPRCAD